MTHGIDLERLNQVASAGGPRDSVPVTRRFLAQVYAELRASRDDQPTLDFDNHTISFNAQSFGFSPNQSGAVPV